MEGRKLGNPNRLSYDPSFFSTLSSVENRHFWFRGRNLVIGAIVGQIMRGLPANSQILEVGCGTGNVLNVLERTCPQATVIGADLFADGLQYARRRTTCHVVRSDIQNLPFRDEFHLVGLFDLLEHIPNDVKVLHSINSLLLPGGVLFVTVPANRSLWSYFDEESRHCRRYESTELEGKLTDAGFRVEYLTYYMATIFHLVWIRRRLLTWLGRILGGTQNHSRELTLSELKITPIINNALFLLISLEARAIARRYTLPNGVSLLAVARKRA